MTFLVPKILILNFRKKTKMKIFGIVACILTGFSESKRRGIDLVDFQKPGGSGGSRPSGGSSSSFNEDYDHPCYNVDQQTTEYCI